MVLVDGGGRLVEGDDLGAFFGLGRLQGSGGWGGCFGGFVLGEEGFVCIRREGELSEIAARLDGVFLDGHVVWGGSGESVAGSGDELTGGEGIERDAEDCAALAGDAFVAGFKAPCVALGTEGAEDGRLRIGHGFSLA